MSQLVNEELNSVHDNENYSSTFEGLTFSQWTDEEWEEFIEEKFLQTQSRFESFSNSLMAECQRVAQGVYSVLLGKFSEGFDAQRAKLEKSV